MKFAGSETTLSGQQKSHAHPPLTPLYDRQWNDQHNKNKTHATTTTMVNSFQSPGPNIPIFQDSSLDVLYDTVSIRTSLIRPKTAACPDYQSRNTEIRKRG